jgi:hypothetical protein
MPGRRGARWANQAAIAFVAAPALLAGEFAFFLITPRLLLGLPLGADVPDDLS